MQYRANHRGIKEMDIILGNYADAHIFDLDRVELSAFERLLEENDRDLLQWFTGELDFPHKDLRPLFDKISSYANNRLS